MSKPLPYRGKPITGGDWVKGWYVYSEQLNAHYIVEVGFQPNYTYVNSLGIIYVQGSHEVIPESVGRSTGLPDKNRVEIWENDRVRITWDDGKTADYIVIWSEWGFCCDNFAFLPQPEQLEVIGNITETPELME